MESQLAFEWWNDTRYLDRGMARARAERQASIAKPSMRVREKRGFSRGETIRESIKSGRNGIQKKI